MASMAVVVHGVSLWRIPWSPSAWSKRGLVCLAHARFDRAVLHSFLLFRVVGISICPTFPRHPSSERRRTMGGPDRAPNPSIPDSCIEFLSPKPSNRTHSTKIQMSSTNQDQNSVYQELIGFLESQRQDLRLEATKAVLQVVGDR